MTTSIRRIRCSRRWACSRRHRAWNGCRWGRSRSRQCARSRMRSGGTETSSSRRRAATRSSSRELLSSAPGQVPATVRDAVLGRVSQLDNEARTLLEFVSVVPPQAELWLLDAVRLAEVMRSSGVSMPGCSSVVRRRCPSATNWHGSRSSRHSARSGRPCCTGRYCARSSGRELSPRGSSTTPKPPATQPSLLRHATAAGARSAELGAHREAAAQYGARAVGRGLATRRRPRRTALALRVRALPDRPARQSDPGAARGRRALSRCRRPRGGGRRSAPHCRASSGSAAATKKRRPRPGRRSRCSSRFRQARRSRAAYSNVSQLRMLGVRPPAAIEWGTRALRLAEQCQADEIVVHALANVGSAEMLAGREAPAARRSRRALPAPSRQARRRRRACLCQPRHAGRRAAAVRVRRPLPRGRGRLLRRARSRLLRDLSARLARASCARRRPLGHGGGTRYGGAGPSAGITADAHRRLHRRRTPRYPHGRGRARQRAAG